MTTEHELSADLDNLIAGLRIENINLKLAAKQTDALLREMRTVFSIPPYWHERIDALLASQQGEQHSEFRKHLKDCAAEVATWPAYKRESLGVIINGHQLRNALEFLAPDNSPEQLSEDLVIELHAKDDDFPEAGLYAYHSECPEEGAIFLDDAADHPEQAEGAQGERTEDGDTIINRLRLGGLSIDGDNAYKSDILDCVVGALAFGFQGRPAPEESHWLHRFWEIGNAEREARAALAQPSPERGQVVVTKKDGIIVAVTRQDAEGRVLSVIAEAQPSPAPELERPEVVTHSDDAAVDRFSASMKQKLEAARAKGRSGWDDPSSCDVAFLAERLIEHLGKGNAGTFEDVANFAMMLHQRGAHPQVLAEAAGAIERDYLRIIQAQEEKWSGRFEVLEDEAKTLRRERDAAQARVAELEKQEPEFWYRDDGDGGVEFTSPCDGFARPLYAAPVAQAGQVPEGYALMPKTLTAENGAKGIFLGEFREHAKIRCQCIDSDGDADDYCELCHGDGSYLQPVAVRWETIKAIYATAVDKLAAAPQPAKGE